jgi:hypothetical protein
MKRSGVRATPAWFVGAATLGAVCSDGTATPAAAAAAFVFPGIGPRHHQVLVATRQPSISDIAITANFR